MGSEDRPLAPLSGRLKKQSRMKRQTKAKHDILERYLQMWFRILGRKHDKLMYVDGFSFTGVYIEGDGEGGSGSPLIALECLYDAAGDVGDTEAVLVFIDRDRQVIERLKANVAAFEQKRACDEPVCCHGEFAEVVEPYVRMLENERRMRRTVPAFFFVDPYGFAGYPMELLKRILALQSTEVFINVMWIHTEGNMRNADAERHFDALFGCGDWRGLMDLPDKERHKAFLQLYKDRLRAPDGANAQGVRSFELQDKHGNLAYWLVFATNHDLGLEKMKEAMWKVDPTGNFHYYDIGAPGEQALMLDESTYQSEDLKARLLARFEGQQDVPYAEVRRFVLHDTPYLPERHVKRKVMDKLKKAGDIQVRYRTGGKGWDNAVITWIRDPNVEPPKPPRRKPEQTGWDF